MANSNSVSDDRIAREIEAARTLRDALGADADDAELLHDMVEGETSLFEMIDGVINLIREDQEVLDGIAARKKDLETRKERIEFRQSKRKAKIEQALAIFGERTLQRPEITLTLKRNPARLVINDESEIPSQFYKRGEPKLDKAGLKRCLKEGEAVPGAALEPAPDTLTMRTR